MTGAFIVDWIYSYEWIKIFFNIFNDFYSLENVITHICDGFSKNYLINRKLTGYPQQINLKNIAYFSRLTWVMMDTWVDLTPRNLFHELYNLIVDMKNRLQLCCRISSHTLPAAWTQFFKKENKINFLNIRILLCNSDHFSSHLHFVTTRWCKIESFVLLFPIFHPSHMQEVLTIYTRF